MGSNKEHAGRIKSMDFKEITLNPFQGLDHDENMGVALYKLIKKDSTIKYHWDRISIEPMTRKTILDICKTKNRNILEEKIDNKDIIIAKNMQEVFNILNKKIY